jgi:Mrp family chromosome partitioning ATPase
MMPDERPQKKSIKHRVLLSVPLSPEQKRELVRRAGVKPISNYAREVLFAANDNTPPKPRRIRRDKDRETLAAGVLAQLGKSEVASSLREIARGVRLGVIVLTPETETALREAAETVNAAAQAALRILGVRPR